VSSARALGVLFVLLLVTGCPRKEAPPAQLLEWTPSDGWEPICERLGLPVPNEPFPVTNTTDDFETQQTLYGPVGGVSEISLSTTAVGDAGSHTGLFERRQTPSDGDPTQGGTEWHPCAGYQCSR